jgi:hypothetical protein
MKNTVVVGGNKMWVTFCPQKAKKVIHILLNSIKKTILLQNKKVALAICDRLLLKSTIFLCYYLLY